MEDNIPEYKKEYTEKRVWSLGNFLASVIVFLIIVFVFLFITISLNLDLLFLTMIACFFIVIYSIILFFLLEPRVIRQINTTNVKTIQTEKPVIIERVVEKPIQVVHEVEKKIYVTSDPIEKIVYKQAPKKTLDIHKYEYLGSSETKTYHKRSCRLSKLIKQKYKVLNDSPSYFTRNHYKPCEVCILKRKKV